MTAWQKAVSDRGVEGERGAGYGYETNTMIDAVKILVGANKRSGCSPVVKAFCVF